MVAALQTEWEESLRVSDEERGGRTRREVRQKKQSSNIILAPRGWTGKTENENAKPNSTPECDNVPLSGFPPDVAAHSWHWHVSIFAKFVCFPVSQVLMDRGYAEIGDCGSACWRLVIIITTTIIQHKYLTSTSCSRYPLTVIWVLFFFLTTISKCLLMEGIIRLLTWGFISTLNVSKWASDILCVIWLCRGRYSGICTCMKSVLVKIMLRYNFTNYI